MADHGAPLGIRGLGAEADEAEARGGEDRGPHVHARLHRDGREAVRQDVDEDDAEPAGADGARRLDERLGLDREGLALYEPHVARPPDERERHDRVHDPGAERPHDGERQDERGHREEHVGHAHDRVPDHAADVARDDPEGHADQPAHEGDEEADPEREPRAEDDARVDVVADLVGAEPVGGAWRLELPVEMHGPARVLGVGHDEGPGRGDQEEGEHERQAEQRGRAPRENPCVAPELAHRGRVALEPGQERGARQCLVHHAAPASRVRGSSQPYARSTRKFASMKLRPSRSVTPMIGWKSLDTAELTA